MGKSAEKEEPVSVIGMQSTEPRSVRRRMVQSTLFPHKSKAEVASNGDARCDDGHRDENDDGENDDVCGSQGAKTRKRKGKIPQNLGASKKLSKEKSPWKSTPKKNATRNGSVAANQATAENASPPVPNLRLEAKLKAEEDSRMSIGKQIHPFFSSWKAGKRNQEAAEAANNSCQGQRRDKNHTIGPIHVYERFQVGELSIDWTNWTFYEETSSGGSCDQQVKINSLFKGFAKRFNLNEPPIVSHPDVLVIGDEGHDQCVTCSEAIRHASPGVSTIQCEQKRKYFQTSEETEGECEVEDIVFLSCHSGAAKEWCDEEQGRSSQESEICSSQPDNSLWIDKYQPRSAVEVCGNSESVKLMNDWLHLWHERGFQPNNDAANCDKEKMLDTDYSCDGSDSDTENIDAGECLKNVLLIIGPVGSGKSAAIHACAKEQGFKVLESNASEFRSGAVVRQKFGEALESYCLTRSLEPTLGSSNEYSLMPTQAISNDAAIGELIEETPVLERESQAHGDRANVKPLILFEDVDICFPEDRGLLSAIQQIAEKAKGPVILTTNDKNHGLPDNLDRLEACFAMPSKKELLSLLSLICAAEKIKVHPGSIEQLIRCCCGDIRKAIMHLQFWFQSKRNGRASTVQNACSPSFFDPDAGHMMLSRIISWDFPSELSLLVENEIAKSLSMAEENSALVDVYVEEVDNEEKLNGSFRCNDEKDSIEAKKAAMLRRNASFENCNEFEEILSSPCELGGAFYRPLSYSQRRTRRKLNVVLSSDSEDEPLDERHPFISSNHSDGGLVIEDNGHFPSQCIDKKKGTIPIIDAPNPFQAEMSGASCYHSEISKMSCMDASCQSADASCVPESSFVPETHIDNGAELSSREISCGHFDGIVEVSMSEDFLQDPSSVDRCMDRLHSKSSNNLRNACEVIAESSHGAETEECFVEYARNALRQCHVTDECSRMDFNKVPKPVEKLKFDPLKDAAQESWKKLRSSHADIKPYLDSEPMYAPQILDLTYQMSNVISESDLCRSRCQKLGAFESTLDSSGVVNTFGLHEELQQMASTVAQKCFYFYAKEIAAMGLSPSFVTTDDLNLELFDPTTNMIAQGESTEHEAKLGNISSGQSCSEMNQETSEGFVKSKRTSCLSGIIKSMVPAKSYLALEGDAFHEYASFLGQISKSGNSHSSKAMEQTRQRRSRGARHYLSTGSLTLSSEDIAFLGQHSTYRKTPT